MIDKLVKLKNDISIGVLEFGDLNSSNVVFYLHGFPGCRYEPLFIEKYACKNNFKVISIDRIGYGNSTYIKDLTIHNFGPIFRDIVDTLGIDKFCVIAVSGGSPYLASVCLNLQDRVKKAILFSGLAPINDKKVLKNLNIANKVFLNIGLKFPNIALFEVSIVAYLWKLYPNIMVIWLKIFMSKADKKILSIKDNNRYIKKNFIESVKNGIDGIKKDFELYCKPWNIDFSKIDVPVTIFHGDDDPYVTYEMGEYLASLYKNCEFHRINRQGHLAIINNINKIIEIICK